MNPLAQDLDDVLVRMGDAWEDLRGARVFVTGGTGFFGCWLLETLLWATDRLGLGVAVSVLTRSPAQFVQKAPHLAQHRVVSLLAGDVRTFSFPDGRFTHVVHAATDSGAGASRTSDLAMFDTIVEGTRRVLDFTRTSGATRVLLTSSGAVYGPQPQGMTHIAEDYAGAPNPAAARSAYAEGKRAAETLCALYSGDTLQATIARCFTFVGPYLPLDAHFAAGNFIRDTLAGTIVRVQGDGTPYRSYLYASDLSVWLWTILLRGEPLRPYNVGSEAPVSIAELARLVAREKSPEATVHMARTPQPGGAVHRYVPSTARARNELGLRQTVDLEQAIARTRAWHARATQRIATADSRSSS